MRPVGLVLEEAFHPFVAFAILPLFVTELAFNDAGILARAKVGILAASPVAALWGAVVLQLCLRRPRD